MLKTLCYVVLDKFFLIFFGKYVLDKVAWECPKDVYKYCFKLLNIGLVTLEIFNDQ